MRLARVGNHGSEKPALLDRNGFYRDLSGHVRDIAGDALSDIALSKLGAIDPDSLPIIADVERLGPCVGSVSKIVCVGLNYSDHAAEAGMEVPSEPIIFMKASTAICGPDDEILMPRGATKLDWEIELCAVIGKRAQYVSETEALSHVAGYCIINDISERAFQAERQGQWTKGKSHDTFAPLGPWLVTKDEIPDAQNLGMRLSVNDRVCQQGSTRTMVFGVAFLVSYVSQFMTLMPGDIVATGTPPGVGLGRKPPVFLKIGDVMRLEIEGLGVQHQTVVAV